MTANEDAAAEVERGWEDVERMWDRLDLRRVDDLMLQALDAADGGPDA